MLFLFLDENGDQVFVTNRIESNGKGKIWVDYYIVNTSGKHLSPKFKNKMKAQRALFKYADGNSIRKPLEPTKGWSTCYGRNCLKCNSDICDGHKSIKIKIAANILKKTDFEEL
jgi:hypothetical protein